MIPEKKLASLLAENGLITDEQLEKAAEYQEKNKGTLQEAMIRLGLVSEDDIIATMVERFDFSYIRLSNYTIDKNCLQHISKEHCERYRAIPISQEENLLTVAMANPTDILAIDELKAQSGLEIFPVIAKETEIVVALTRYYTTEDESIRAISQRIEGQYNLDIDQEKLLETLDEDDKDSALIVQLANRVIENAYFQGASDIHIEPFEKFGLIRCRIDGVLQETLRLPIQSLTPMVARLKIMSHINISENRLPLDGRIVFKHFTSKQLDFDLRVSTIPTAYGQKVVMRILDHSNVQVEISKMGYSTHNLERYKEEIAKPYGMVLHVGPTGSGKTTSLYAALSHVSSPTKNIQTAEDPIEYNLGGINQCQIRPEIGFHFARALRAFLRQDPDIIMIGEIRDVETAEIAIEAALTGHMVFSTLHTNDAATTISRFIEMDIEPFLVSSSVVCVVAQRLVRALCRCKQFRPASAMELNTLDLSDATNIPRPGGCKKCNSSGYKGRLGLHEVLVMDDEIRNLVNDKEPSHKIHQAAMKNGMLTMFQDGTEKVMAGHTSLEELLRVLR